MHEAEGMAGTPTLDGEGVPAPRPAEEWTASTATTLVETAQSEAPAAETPSPEPSPEESPKAAPVDAEALPVEATLVEPPAVEMPEVEARLNGPTAEVPEYQPVAAVPQPGWFANANTVETGYVTAEEPSTSEVAEAEAEPSVDAEAEPRPRRTLLSRPPTP